jgi:3-hydroxybutyryl-CoA dehydrogenase
MKVLIAGETPFIDEVARLCLAVEHDIDIYLVEDFLAAIENGYAFQGTSEIEVAIEMHNESATAKQELLTAMVEAIPYNALVLTSALATSATQAASWVFRPERAIGFGVLPPLRHGGLVELAAGLQTSAESIERTKSFWKGLGLESVVVSDGPGLVRARIVCCLINEAVSALMEGIATAEDIDKAMRLGTNYPYGPLEWADYLGLDVVLGVMKGLFEEWGDDRYRPSPLLRRMVVAGRLGKKTGLGFFEY